MGQIAEDMVDGSCCQLCGCYFGNPKGGIYVHEHPVVCFDCWKELTTKEKKGYQKAEVRTI
jgi:hypothetical protein